MRRAGSGYNGVVVFGEVRCWRAYFRTSGESRLPSVLREFYVGMLKFLVSGVEGMKSGVGVWC